MVILSACREYVLILYLTLKFIQKIVCIPLNMSNLYFTNSTSLSHIQYNIRFKRSVLQPMLYTNCSLLYKFLLFQIEISKRIADLSSHKNRCRQFKNRQLLQYLLSTSIEHFFLHAMFFIHRLSVDRISSKEIQKRVAWKSPSFASDEVKIDFKQTLPLSLSLSLSSPHSLSHTHKDTHARTNKHSPRKRSEQTSLRLVA